MIFDIIKTSNYNMINIIDDIYCSKLLKYPLDNIEYKFINETWEFISHFPFDTIYINDYRKNIIQKIKSKYTPELFFQYEKIANKLFWNLRWLLYPFVLDIVDQGKYKKFIKNYHKIPNIPDDILSCETKYYKSQEELENIINQNKLELYYRSFINKLIIFDKDKIICKKMESSANIFHQNIFNLTSFTIFFQRNLYEKVIRNPFYIFKTKINLPLFYYQQDYAFPNLNMCVYEIGTKEQKMKRIKKMYFENNSENNWFVICYT